MCIINSVNISIFYLNLFYFLHKNYCSSPWPLGSGVPLGSILCSSLLLNIYLYGTIGRAYQEGGLGSYQYTDDTQLWHSVPSDSKELDWCLGSLINWMRINKPKFKQDGSTIAWNWFQTCLTGLQFLDDPGLQLECFLGSRIASGCLTGIQLNTPVDQKRERKCLFYFSCQILKKGTQTGFKMAAASRDQTQACRGIDSVWTEHPKST